jgi:hypothetical protein
VRSWTLAGAFDAGHIRGGTPGWERDLDFHQLELTGHGQQLEEDYRLFRGEFGLQWYRDGAWLARSFPGHDRFDWDYLDRVAEASEGAVTLSLCHYEWPVWATEEDVWTGRVHEAMVRFASAVAHRYRGCFAAYIPVVEAGYWTAMMTDWGRWWPARRGGEPITWWRMWGVVGRMMLAMARAVREADPETPIALSEPWAWHPDLSMDDQGRAFNTLLGRPDPVCVRETGPGGWDGDPSLLQIAGLNFYNNWGEEQGWPLSRLLLEARSRYPEQSLVMGETGNCHFSKRFSVRDWLALIDRQVEAANARGARIEQVTWAPILTLGDFDWGRPAPGAWVSWDPEDPRRRRLWDPETARVVRQYTAASVGAPASKIRASTATPAPAPGSHFFSSFLHVRLPVCHNRLT